MLLRATAASLAVVYFSTQVVAAPYVERNFFRDRREAAARRSDPARFAAALPAAELALQKITAGPALPASAAAPFRVPAGAPAWLRAVAAAPVEVKEFRSGAGGLVVYHLQDVHEQAEAQLNISRTIESLAASGRPLVVGLEGAAGAFRVAPFRRLPDAALRRELAGALLEKNLLSGAEHAALSAETAPLLWGVEDAAEYRRHVAAFRRSAAAEESAAARLAALEASLDELRRRLYPAAALEWDAARRRFESSGEGLAAYVAALGVPERGFPQAARFRASWELERGIAFDRVEAERRRALEDLAAVLTEAELAELVRRGLEYRLGGAGYGAFYAHLDRLCASRGLDLARRYPQLALYVRYVGLAEGIRPEALFEELARLEDRAAERLLPPGPARRAHEISRDLALLKKLVDRSMDDPAWRRFTAARGRAAALPRRLAALRAAAGLPAGDAAPLPALEDFEAFYAAAERRNDALAGNLLARLEAEGASAGVLVAGGFHTPGLVRRLAERGVSYAVLSPRLTKAGDGTAYLDFFRRESTPLEKLFRGEKILLKHTQALAEEALAEGQPALAGAVEGAYVALASVRRAAEFLAASSGMTETQREELTAWAAGGFETVEKAELEDVETLRADGAPRRVTATLTLSGRVNGKISVRRVRAEWTAPGVEGADGAPVFESVSETGRLRLFPAARRGPAAWLAALRARFRAAGPRTLEERTLSFAHDEIVRYGSVSNDGAPNASAELFPKTIFKRPFVQGTFRVTRSLHETARRLMPDGYRVLSWNVRHLKGVFEGEDLRLRSRVLGERRGRAKLAVELVNAAGETALSMEAEVSRGDRPRPGFAARLRNFWRDLPRLRAPREEAWTASVFSQVRRGSVYRLSHAFAAEELDRLRGLLGAGVAPGAVSEYVAAGLISGVAATKTVDYRRVYPLYVSQSLEFPGAEVRPGDVLTAEARAVKVLDRRKRRMLFETTVRNQRGETLASGTLVLQFFVAGVKPPRAAPPALTRGERFLLWLWGTPLRGLSARVRVYDFISAAEIRERLAGAPAVAPPAPGDRPAFLPPAALVPGRVILWRKAVQKYRAIFHDGGTVEPLVVKREADGTVLIWEGQHRWAAALEEGVDLLPVVWYDKIYPSAAPPAGAFHGEDFFDRVWVPLVTDLARAGRLVKESFLAALRLSPEEKLWALGSDLHPDLRDGRTRAGWLARLGPHRGRYELFQALWTNRPAAKKGGAPRLIASGEGTRHAPAVAEALRLAGKTLGITEISLDVAAGRAPPKSGVDAGLLAGYFTDREGRTRLVVHESVLAEHEGHLVQFLVLFIAHEYAERRLRAAGTADPHGAVVRAGLGLDDFLTLARDANLPEAAAWARRVAALLGALEGSPAAVELATAEPGRLRELKSSLGDGWPAAAAEAAELVNRRLARLLPGVRDLEAEQKFDRYDDLLRLLWLQGALEGEIVYPVIGPDFLPARWADVLGINWRDYRPAFRDMTKRAGRPDYAAGVGDGSRVRVSGIKNIFDARFLREVLARFPRRGSRTLLLKGAEGQARGPEFYASALKRGAYYGPVSENQVGYLEWLRLLADEWLAPGDHVAVLSKDGRTAAFFDKAGDFERVPLKLPAAKLLRDDTISGSAVGSLNQNLEFPTEARVYRKKGAAVRPAGALFGGLFDRRVWRPLLDELAALKREEHRLWDAFADGLEAGGFPSLAAWLRRAHEWQVPDILSPLSGARFVFDRALAACGLALVSGLPASAPAEAEDIARRVSARLGLGLVFHSIRGDGEALAGFDPSVAAGHFAEGRTLHLAVHEKVFEGWRGLDAANAFAVFVLHEALEAKLNGLGVPDAHGVVVAAGFVPGDARTAGLSLDELLAAAETLLKGARLPAARSTDAAGGKVLAFDIGGTWFRSAVVAGTRVDAATVRRGPTPNFLRNPGDSPEEIQRLIVERAAEAIAAARSADPSLRAVSVGFAGVVGADQRILRAPTIFGPAALAEPFDLKGRLEARFPGLSVFVVNDMIAAGWRYREEKRYAYLTVSSGVGLRMFDDRLPGLVVADEALLLGGGVGQMPAGDSGLSLGEWSSGRGAARLVLAAAEKQPSRFEGSELRAVLSMASPDLDEVSRLLAESAAAGDRLALEFIDEAIVPLADRLAFLRAAVGVDTFVIGGGFARSVGDVYVRKLAAAMRDRLPLAGDHPFEVKPAAADDDSGLIGAARYAASRVPAAEPETDPVLAKGRAIFGDAVRRSRRAAWLSADGWRDRLMAWGMEKPARKEFLLGFLTAYPFFKSPKETKAYLAAAGRKGELPFGLLARGLVAAGPARLVDAFARANISWMARRFIAGADAAETAGVLRRLRADGVGFTVDILGEGNPGADPGDERRRQELERWADANMRRYIALTDEVSSSVGEANLSIKLTALVWRLDVANKETAKDRLREIVRAARARNAFVRIDMEQHEYRDLTLRIFKELLDEPEFAGYEGLGIVLQAYLRDTEKDARDLLAWAAAGGRRVPIRLVKGAYWESETKSAAASGRAPPVWSEKWESDAGYERLARLLLENIGRVKPAFASHNVRSLSFVAAEAERLGVSPDEFEFQMLYGMGDPLKAALVKSGYRVRAYVPYGPLHEGLAYLIRRIQENTSNESMLKQTFGGDRTLDELLAAPGPRAAAAPAGRRFPVSGDRLFSAGVLLAAPVAAGLAAFGSAGWPLLAAAPALYALLAAALGLLRASVSREGRAASAADAALSVAAALVWVFGVFLLASFAAGAVLPAGWASFAGGVAAAYGALGGLLKFPVSKRASLEEPDFVVNVPSERLFPNGSAELELPAPGDAPILFDRAGAAREAGEMEDYARAAVSRAGPTARRRQRTAFTAAERGALEELSRRLAEAVRPLEGALLAAPVEEAARFMAALQWREMKVLAAEGVLGRDLADELLAFFHAARAGDVMHWSPRRDVVHWVIEPTISRGQVNSVHAAFSLGGGVFLKSDMDGNRLGFLAAEYVYAPNVEVLRYASDAEDLRAAAFAAAERLRRTPYGKWDALAAARTCGSTCVEGIHEMLAKAGYAPARWGLAEALTKRLVWMFGPLYAAQKTSARLVSAPLTAPGGAAVSWRTVFRGRDWRASATPAPAVPAPQGKILPFVVSPGIVRRDPRRHEKETVSPLIRSLKDRLRPGAAGATDAAVFLPVFEPRLDWFRLIALNDFLYDIYVNAMFLWDMYRYHGPVPAAEKRWPFLKLYGRTRVTLKQTIRLLEGAGRAAPAGYFPVTYSASYRPMLDAIRAQGRPVKGLLSLAGADFPHNNGRPLEMPEGFEYILNVYGTKDGFLNNPFFGQLVGKKTYPDVEVWNVRVEEMGHNTFLGHPAYEGNPGDAEFVRSAALLAQDREAFLDYVSRIRGEEPEATRAEFRKTGEVSLKLPSEARLREIFDAVAAARGLAHLKLSPEYAVAEAPAGFSALHAGSVVDLVEAAATRTFGVPIPFNRVAAKLAERLPLSAPELARLRLALAMLAEDASATVRGELWRFVDVLPRLLGDYLVEYYLPYQAPAAGDGLEPVRAEVESAFRQAAASEPAFGGKTMSVRSHGGDEFVAGAGVHVLAPFLRRPDGSIVWSLHRRLLQALAAQDGKKRDELVGSLVARELELQRLLQKGTHFDAAHALVSTMDGQDELEALARAAAAPAGAAVRPHASLARRLLGERAPGKEFVFADADGWQPFLRARARSGRHSETAAIFKELGGSHLKRISGPRFMNALGRTLAFVPADAGGAEGVSFLRAEIMAEARRNPGEWIFVIEGLGSAGAGPEALFAEHLARASGVLAVDVTVKPAGDWAVPELLKLAAERAESGPFTTDSLYTYFLAQAFAANPALDPEEVLSRAARAWGVPVTTLQRLAEVFYAEGRRAPAALSAQLAAAGRFVDDAAEELSARLLRYHLSKEPSRKKVLVVGASDAAFFRRVEGTSASDLERLAFEKSRPPSAPATRAAQIATMSSGPADVLVIGGGISGVGVLLETVRRGLRGALIEFGDFARATSSRTTSLIHAGIRYLEKLDIGLVREGIQQRALLETVAPYLAKPLPFLITSYDDDRRGLLKVGLGALFYSFLAGNKARRPRLLWGAESVKNLVPEIQAEGLAGASLYYDSETDDARLTVETAKTAVGLGAAAAPNVEFLEYIADGDGRVRGVWARDRESGRRFPIFSQKIVVTGGPYAQRLWEKDPAYDGGQLLTFKKAKGTHIIVPKLSDSRYAIVIQSKDGKRIFFVIPKGEYAMIGTTEVDVDEKDLDRQQPTEAEIEEILAETRKLFPDRPLDRSSVVSSFSGVRPLVLEEPGRGPAPALLGAAALALIGGYAVAGLFGVAVAGLPALAAAALAVRHALSRRDRSEYVSRNHVTKTSKSGIVYALGGKLTIHRKMAEDVLDALDNGLGGAENGPAPALQGGDAAAYDALRSAESVARLSAWYGASPAAVSSLVERYGGSAVTILRLAQARPGLLERLVPGLPYLRAEIAYAVHHEMAEHLQDVMFRRTQFSRSDYAGEETARMVAREMALYLDWDDERIELEVKDYLAARQVPEKRARPRAPPLSGRLLPDGAPVLVGAGLEEQGRLRRAHRRASSLLREFRVRLGPARPAFLVPVFDASQPLSAAFGRLRGWLAAPFRLFPGFRRDRVTSGMERRLGSLESAGRVDLGKPYLPVLHGASYGAGLDVFRSKGSPVPVIVSVAGTDARGRLGAALGIPALRAVVNVYGGRDKRRKLVGRKHYAGTPVLNVKVAGMTHDSFLDRPAEMSFISGLVERAADAEALVGYVASAAGLTADQVSLAIEESAEIAVVLPGPADHALKLGRFARLRREARMLWLTRVKRPFVEPAQDFVKSAYRLLLERPDYLFSRWMKSDAHAKYLAHRRSLALHNDFDLGNPQVREKMRSLGAPPFWPLRVAHRGASGHLPENRIETFRRGFEMGASHFETDVQFSREGEPVISHDADIPGKGPVQNFTVDELRAMGLPTLRDVFEMMKSLPKDGRRRGAILELKNNGAVGTAEVVPYKVARLIEEYGLEDSVMALSFDAALVKKVKELNPRIVTGLNWDQAGDPVAAGLRAGVDFVSLNKPLISRRLVRHAHEKGLAVAAWTVNDPLQMQWLAEIGADIVMSDFPDRLTAAYGPGEEPAAVASDHDNINWVLKTRRLGVWFVKSYIYMAAIGLVLMAPVILWDAPSFLYEHWVSSNAALFAAILAALVAVKRTGKALFESWTFAGRDLAVLAGVGFVGVHLVVLGLAALSGWPMLHYLVAYAAITAVTLIKRAVFPRDSRLGASLDGLLTYIGALMWVGLIVTGLQHAVGWGAGLAGLSITAMQQSLLTLTIYMAVVWTPLTRLFPELETEETLPPASEKLLPWETPGVVSSFLKDDRERIEADLLEMEKAQNEVVVRLNRPGGEGWKFFLRERRRFTPEEEAQLEALEGRLEERLRPFTTLLQTLPAEDVVRLMASIQWSEMKAAAHPPAGEPRRLSPALFEELLYWFRVAQPGDLLFWTFRGTIYHQFNERSNIPGRVPAVHAALSLGRGVYLETNPEGVRFLFMSAEYRSSPNLRVARVDSLSDKQRRDVVRFAGEGRGTPYAALNNFVGAQSIGQNCVALSKWAFRRAGVLMRMTGFRWWQYLVHQHSFALGPLAGLGVASPSSLLMSVVQSEKGEEQRWKVVFRGRDWRAYRLKRLWNVLKFWERGPRMLYTPGHLAAAAVRRAWARFTDWVGRLRPAHAPDKVRDRMLKNFRRAAHFANWGMWLRTGLGLAQFVAAGLVAVSYFGVTVPYVTPLGVALAAVTMFRSAANWEGLLNAAQIHHAAAAHTWLSDDADPKRRRALERAARVTVWGGWLRTALNTLQVGMAGILVASLFGVQIPYLTALSYVFTVLALVRGVANWEAMLNALQLQYAAKALRRAAEAASDAADGRTPRLPARTVDDLFPELRQLIAEGKVRAVPGQPVALPTLWAARAAFVSPDETTYRVTVNLAVMPYLPHWLQRMTYHYQRSRFKLYRWIDDHPLLMSLFQSRVDEHVLVGVVDVSLWAAEWVAARFSGGTLSSRSSATDPVTERAPLPRPLAGSNHGLAPELQELIAQGKVHAVDGPPMTVPTLWATRAAVTAAEGDGFRVKVNLAIMPYLPLSLQRRLYHYQRTRFKVYRLAERHPMYMVLFQSRVDEHVLIGLADLAIWFYEGVVLGIAALAHRTEAALSEVVHAASARAAAAFRRLLPARFAALLDRRAARRRNAGAQKVLETYFERMRLLSRFDEERPAREIIFPSRERFSPDLAAGLSEARGVYLGTGLGQNFNYMALLSVEEGHIIGSHAEVMEGLMPLFGMVTLRGRTRAEMIALILGFRMPRHDLVRLQDAPLSAVYEYFLRRYAAEKPSKKALWADVEAAILPRVRPESRERVAHALRAFLTRDEAVFYYMKDQLDAGGGWLQSEPSYQKLRRMWWDNRVTGLVGDYTGHALAKLSEYLHQNEKKVGVVHLADLEPEQSAAARSREGVRSLVRLYDNLDSIPRTRDTPVISRVGAGVRADSVEKLWGLSRGLNEELKRFETAFGFLEEEADAEVTWAVSVAADFARARGGAVTVEAAGAERHRAAGADYRPLSELLDYLRREVEAASSAREFLDDLEHRRVYPGHFDILADLLPLLFEYYPWMGEDHLVQAVHRARERHEREVRSKGAGLPPHWSPLWPVPDEKDMEEAEALRRGGHAERAPGPGAFRALLFADPEGLVVRLERLAAGREGVAVAGEWLASVGQPEMVRTLIDFAARRGENPAPWIAGLGQFSTDDLIKVLSGLRPEGLRLTLASWHDAFGDTEAAVPQSVVRALRSMKSSLLHAVLAGARTRALDWADAWANPSRRELQEPFAYEADPARSFAYPDAAALGFLSVEDSLEVARLLKRLLLEAHQKIPWSAHIGNALGYTRQLETAARRKNWNDAAVSWGRVRNEIEALKRSRHRGLASETPALALLEHERFGGAVDALFRARIAEKGIKGLDPIYPFDVTGRLVVVEDPERDAERLANLQPDDIVVLPWLPRNEGALLKARAVVVSREEGGLSHRALRARSLGLLLVQMPWAPSMLKGLEGSSVRLIASAAGATIRPLRLWESSSRGGENPRRAEGGTPALRTPPPLEGRASRPLSELAGASADVWTEKAVGLGRLIAAGIGVPDGFAVQAGVYAEFMDGTGLRGRIQRLLTDIDPSDPEDVRWRLGEIQGWIAAAPMPEKVAEAFREGLRGMFGAEESARPPLFVRATSNETRLDAGVYESFPNADAGQLIRTDEEVLAAFRRAVMSVWKERAFYARRALGVSDFDVHLGAIVQKAADVAEVGKAPAGQAGVVYVDAGRIVVEAVWGYGRASVSNEGEPARYVYDRATGLWEEENRLSAKAVSTQMNAGQNRMEEFELPRALRYKEVLSAKERELVRRAAEAAFAAEGGRPLVLEWLLERGSPKEALVTEIRRAGPTATAGGPSGPGFGSLAPLVVAGVVALNAANAYAGDGSGGAGADWTLGAALLLVLPAIFAARALFRAALSALRRRAAARIEASPLAEEALLAEAIPLPLNLEETDLSRALRAAAGVAPGDDLEAKLGYAALAALFGGRRPGLLVPPEAAKNLSAALRREMARGLADAHYLDEDALASRLDEISRRTLAAQTEELWRRRSAVLAEGLRGLGTMKGEDAESLAARVVALVEQAGRNDGLEAALGGRSPSASAVESAATLLAGLNEFWTASFGRPWTPAAARALRRTYAEAFRQGRAAAVVKDAAELRRTRTSGADWIVSLFDLGAFSSGELSPRALEQLAGRLRDIREDEAGRTFLPVYVGDAARSGAASADALVASLVGGLQARGRTEEAGRLAALARAGLVGVVSARDLGLREGEPASPEAALRHVRETFLRREPVSLFELYTEDARRWSEEWRSDVRFRLLVILSETRVLEVLGSLEQGLEAARLLAIQA